MRFAAAAVLQRVAVGLGRRARIVRHHGETVWCPVCDSHFSRFMDDWNRPRALCWRCGAHERHRAQWLLLSERVDLLGRCRRLLHLAPEHCLRGRLQEAAAAAGFAYVTGDLDPLGVDLGLDLTALALPDGSFDAVICSHVLEHVDDDITAIRELGG